MSCSRLSLGKPCRGEGKGSKGPLGTEGQGGVGQVWTMLTVMVRVRVGGSGASLPFSD